MANITRIKNNQITDNTIEYQKLKDGTLVGTKFNANVTLNSNITIIGNLDVQGTTSTVQSTNTYINDPLVIFNNGYTSTPSYDIGILVNRNLTATAPYGSVNAAFVWQEATDAFIGVMTTETGTTQGAINNSGFANLFIGNIYANTTTIRDSVTSTSPTTGALIVEGGIGTNENIFAQGTIIANGNIVANSGTESTGNAHGALVVNGGAGISGNLNVGYDAIIDGNLIVVQNLVVFGNTTRLDTENITSIDPMIILNESSTTPLTSDNGYDIGIQYNYFDGINAQAFLGRKNSTKFLEWHALGSEVNNVFTGTDWGTFKLGELWAANVTDSTDKTTGALRVDGGAGIAANVFVGKSATFNDNQDNNQNFYVRGVNTENLFWARSNSTYDQVLIGNTAPVGNLVVGAKLMINSTDSMILPVGDTSQRPSNSGGVDTTGMLRFNVTSGFMEVYNGTSWQSISTQFTVITDEQFNGDDSTTDFTLAGASTTNGTLVNINGTTQIPTLAYSVLPDGVTLRFTEAPATGDLIDVRRLTTTSEVIAIASQNGYMQLTSENVGIKIFTGSSSKDLTTYWDPTGARVSARANVNVSTANVATTIDTFDSAVYRSAKYLVQATCGADYHMSEVLVIHDDTTATAVTYGVVETGANVGVMNATISGGDVQLQFIAETGDVDVRVDKTYSLI